MKDTGCIYILTNPSFPDYVKIGYATNLEKRLKQLNRSETTPSKGPSGSNTMAKCWQICVNALQSSRTQSCPVFQKPIENNQMVTVKTQKELKEAIKAKESPIVPGNRRMAVLLSVIAALFELTEKNGERPTAKEVVSIILAEGFGGKTVGAIAESTLIILVISSLVAAVLIVAICKGQKVSVKWDKKKHVFSLETK